MALSPESLDTQLARLSTTDSCSYSEEYKGVFAPKCNDRKGCLACWIKRSRYFENMIVKGL